MAKPAEIPPTLFKEQTEGLFELPCVLPYKLMPETSQGQAVLHPSGQRKRPGNQRPASWIP